MKIYEFKKNIHEKVIIEFAEFKGRELIAMRVYYKASEDKDDWRPTPKGITMSVEHVPELKRGIDKACKEWREQANKPNK